MGRDFLYFPAFFVLLEARTEALNYPFATYLPEQDQRPLGGF